LTTLSKNLFEGLARAFPTVHVYIDGCVDFIGVEWMTSLGIGPPTFPDLAVYVSECLDHESLTKELPSPLGMSIPARRFVERTPDGPESERLTRLYEDSGNELEARLVV
jgi:hypothetical protein